jgi:hypothetical protein
MTYSLKSEDVTVGRLLSGLSAFQIPAFQRDYAWREEQADRLLNDIIAAAENAAQLSTPLPLFLGTMLFVGSDDPAASVRTSLVVDGQQRLLTLTILIAVLRDFATIDEQPELHRRIALLSGFGPLQIDGFHVTPRLADKNFFRRAIQMPGATRDHRARVTLEPGSQAQMNMDEVRSFFLRRVRPMSPQRRSAIAELIFEGCRVLTLWTHDIDYAHSIFLSINKPGLPLTEEDVILAEVIGPLDAEQRQRYQLIVDQMSRYREPRKAGRRQDKTFFTHLGLAQEWASDRMISQLRRAVARAGGPQPFAQTVFEPMADAYIATRGDGSSPGISQKATERLLGLRIIERFCDDEWVPVAMLALDRLKFDEVALDAFLRALDRYAMAMVLLRPIQSERRQAYRRVIAELKAHEQISDPASLFELDDHQQAAVLRRASLRLKDAANGASKAILIRLDAHLSGRPIADYLTLLETTGFTVEHVLPKGERLARASAWNREFPGAENRQACAWSIGNLLLLEESRNADARQHDFADKRSIFFPDDTPHPLHLTEEFRHFADWTREALAARHFRLMQAFKEVWAIDGPIPELPEFDARVHRIASRHARITEGESAANAEANEGSASTAPAVDDPPSS